jgi:hypothetical protein
MRSLFTTALFGITVIVGAVFALFGVYTMIADVSQGGELIKGFMYFSLGIILTLSMLTIYAISALTDAVKILGDLMFKQTKKDMISNMFGGGNPLGGSPQGGSGEHPLAQLFKKIAEDSQRGEFGNGRIKITRMDKDGNMHSLGEREFKSHEDLIKFRDEVLSGAFGKDVDLKDMTIEQLQKEELKAVEKQDFELAASIRDLISEKENRKSEQ